MKADAELLRDLVSIPSVTGAEADAVDFLRTEARRDGFRVLDDPVGNFVAECGEGDRLLLFVGHIDTVPGHIPVRVREGELWGRGAVDAKGPLVAAYCAARRRLRDPTLRIRIVGAVDEEGNSRGAKAIPTDLRPEWILIGEPSGAAAATIGYKGIVRGSFRLERPRHHGAHAGPTAVEEAFAFWATLAGHFAFQDRFESVQGHLTAVETVGDGLVDRVTGRFNLRLPPGLEPDEVQRRVRELASAARVDVDVDETVPPALASKRTPLVAAFLSAIRDQGHEPRLLRKTGTCDFNLLARRHPDVPIAAYGPGDARLDHTPEERIALEEFARAVDVLDHVLASLAASPRATATRLAAPQA